MYCRIISLHGFALLLFDLCDKAIRPKACAFQVRLGFPIASRYGMGTEEAINGFTWYLSAMLIGSYLIYWTLCRNQKRAILHIYYIPYRLLLRHELHLGRRRAPELLDPDFPCHDIWLLAQSGRNGTGLYGLRNR